MGDKWRRSRAWDDEHIPPGLWPIKVVLRAFSSIPLAVVLLVLVAVYGILASVPIGLLAYSPTYLFYAGTLAVSSGVIAGVPIWVLRRLLASAGQGGRFAATLLALIALAPTAAWLWLTYAWPWLRFDPATGAGVRFFGSFVDATKAITLRRLPGMEMSELEFYAWWPLRLILVAFVFNMITATVRRIEFTFRNIGVLTVHTGIVTIAMGSVYYSGLKLEGDMLLRAGALRPDGKPGVGPPESAFFDNTRSALYINQDSRGWEARVLSGVPRYNNYGLGLVGTGTPGESVIEATNRERPWEAEPSRPLAAGVPDSTLGMVDADLSFRLVGYAPYAEPVEDWVKVEPPTRLVNTDSVGHPLRVVYLHSDLPAKDGEAAAPKDDRPAFAFTLAPDQPAERVRVVQGAMGLEYTMGPTGGMPAERWRDLTEPLPAAARHALVVEVPAKNYRGIFAVERGQKLDVADTGYRLEVKDLTPQPPFPIITKGYQNASSSVAIVRVAPPVGEPFDRWVYSRFPEISQDMLSQLNERGMPTRRDADPAIRVSYVDASMVQIFFDEPDPVNNPGATRALVRVPGQAPRVVAGVSDAQRVAFDDHVSLSVGVRWDHAARMERPAPVPAARQTDRQAIGTHDRAMLAVEVSIAPAHGAAPTARRIVWLPFVRYFGLDPSAERAIVLPDGRRLSLAFGRVQHRLPGFEVALVDFEMLAYDHRGSPRDYQSVLRVTPTAADPTFTGFEHVTKLNAPLRAPFHWDDARPYVANVAGQLASGLSPRQFKFSQAGWDAGGWQESQKLVDQGLAQRPVARYTILGVGNNPGIHVIAAGAVMMGLGIPWAFYVKPWLVQREKRRIQRALLEGTYVAKRRTPVLDDTRTPRPDKNDDSSVDGEAEHHAFGTIGTATRADAGQPGGEG